MEVALPVIGLLGQCYTGAVQAYLLIQTAIDFPDAAAKLVIQLEVERIRLQLWGRNSGADSDALYPALALFEPIILEILTKIEKLLTDSDKLKNDYGLVSSMDDSMLDVDRGNQPDRYRLVNQLRKTLRTAAERTSGEKQSKREPSGGSPAPMPTQGTLSRKAYDRIRWAVASKSRFETLVIDLRHLTNNLNELLRESQFQLLSQQWHSIGMHTIAATNDPQVLSTLQEATVGDENCRDILSMARRKSTILSQQGEVGDRDIEDNLDLPADFPNYPRCIAVYRPLLSDQPHKYVLVERKHYDSNISVEDKAKLLSRLHNLIKLINSPPSDYSPCLGYWSEPQSHCWCLVFEFPLHGVIPLNGKNLTTPASPHPLSLLVLIAARTFQPPLEARHGLAFKLASVFSRLYGSKWLHKSICSDNILFPFAGTGGVYDISSPLVTGFEYSRQYTEQETIDRTPYDRTRAIYRHPRYQGLAARGYRMAYDIYAFGLVLAEIAWWVPLESLQTDAVKGKKAEGSASHFGAQEAGELRKRLIKRLRSEMAFRVGTGYKDAVEWCLTRGDEADTLRDAELAVEFYAKLAEFNTGLALMLKHGRNLRLGFWGGNEVP
ncbi:prion-inhibition and propagation-domain-containing protein [Mycena rebaudengoi]|nr:prion-inhibition and propagation-domain-containing protein [Mycena rebaudengoi]